MGILLNKKAADIKFKNILLIFLISLCFLSMQSVWAQIKLSNLKCEMLSNPLGIDARHPRLSWQLESQQRATEQTAYRVLVSSSEEKLNKNEGDLWDSGKKDSDQSLMVAYNGKELKSREDCFWKVKVWTNNGQSGWSEPALWNTGFLYYKDWSGRWIGFDRPFPWDSVTFHSKLSARYFRREFEVKKNINKARVYIIGVGLYELYFNGKKIGDQVLAPAPTDFTKNVKYNVFEVAKVLRPGKNAVGVILGNGRYFSMRQNYKPYKIKTFGYPKLLMQLEIEYEDGSMDVLKTDSSWKGTADGPIRSNNEYDGEDYDARKEMPGWSSIGFDDSKWLDAEYVQQPRGEFEAQMNPNIKVMDTIHPVGIKKLSPGKYILDMGQNMAGWIKMKVEGKTGDTVQLRFAEILKDDGEIFTANLRGAEQTDHYMLKGKGMEKWAPRFVYHGFRYVEITGYPGEPKPEDFTGEVVYDDMATVGHFETSNPLINKIYKNACWGIRGNYKGMPVDCPQRNEREPWLGDRSTGCYGESFIFNNIGLYNKWIDDIGYSQKKDGSISDVAPAYWRYYSDNMTWPGTYLMVADMLYRQYGEIMPIEQHYQSMKKWLQYMKDLYMTNKFIITKDSYGDWCAPPKTIEDGRGKSADQKYPSELISTAYYYYFLGLMEKFARLTKNNQDIPEFNELAENIRTSFNKTFYHSDFCGYDKNKLTDNLLALYFGLVPNEEHEKVFNTIIKTIENYGGHLSTGVIGTQWIMRTLTRNGRSDLAYQLADNKTYPSWGYMVENGATTIWELWNGNTAAADMNSYNHVMLLGDLIIWYYEDLAGIKSGLEKPGFKQIVMKPELAGDLNYVNASYHSNYGKIKSDWKKNGINFSWDISVPANSSAVVYVPASSLESVTESGKKYPEAAGVHLLKVEGNRVVFEIGSGDYYFQSKLSK